MRSFVLILFINFFAFPLFAQQIVLEGAYNGVNLFVQNPFAECGVGFCCYGVSVNGELSTTETESSAFEIKLDKLGCVVGEQLKVVLFHKEGCKPKVLMQMHPPRPRADFVSLDIDNQGVLKLIIGPDRRTIKLFIAEQFRWNKWIKIAELSEPDTLGGITYSFKITDMHSGENKFRVKQITYNNRPHYSKSVKVVGDYPPPVFKYDQEKKMIEFSTVTQFEIYDDFGNLVKRGYDSNVECSKLKRGKYYLNYDIVQTKFRVKLRKKQF